MEKQVTMSPQTLEQLRGDGVTEETKLKLEVVFYANTNEKASGLLAELTALDYEVGSEPSAHDKKTLIVTGWSTPILMNTQELVSWTKDMCNSGYKHDCEFDGWGTNPEQ